MNRQQQLKVNNVLKQAERKLMKILSREVILRYYVNESENITYSDIELAVSIYYNETKDNITSKSRKREHVMCRDLIAYFARKYTSLSLKKIGLLLGGRDHSTIITSIGRTEDDYHNTRKDVEKIDNILNKKSLEKEYICDVVN